MYDKQTSKDTIILEADIGRSGVASMTGDYGPGPGVPPRPPNRIVAAPDGNGNGFSSLLAPTGHGTIKMEF